MSAPAYTPDRGLRAKINRRMTQWRAAAPAWIAPGQPALSVTFDDIPASAAEAGAAVLERAGVRGTFYHCAGLMGAATPFGPGFAPADVSALLSAGHEIGCHTFSHLDCATATPAQVAAEVEKNARAMAALGAPAAESFAFPYGEATFAVKQALRARFATGRGVLPGVNIARVDRMQLRACALFEHDTESPHRWLARAARLSGWLIVFTHDVAPAPSAFGISPDALARFIEAAQKLDFAIAPVCAVARSRLPEAAR